MTTDAQSGPIRRRPEHFGSGADLTEEAWGVDLMQNCGYLCGKILFEVGHRLDAINFDSL